MATKHRKPILFNSPALHALMLERAYDMTLEGRERDLRARRWFDHVSYWEREDFALKYGTKLWNVCPNGNPTAIVISYPRPHGGKVMVRVFDLDSGEKFWVPFSAFTSKRVSGRNHADNYNYNGVMLDHYRPESEDIQMNVDWESLEAFDKGTDHSPIIGGARVVKLISLPKAVKDRLGMR